MSADFWSGVWTDRNASSALCSVTEFPCLIEGSKPLLLHPIAGKIPDRQLIPGSDAEKYGIQAGNTYLLKYREENSYPSWGKRYEWHVDELITNPLRVIHLQEKMGNGEVFEVPGIDFHHCSVPDYFLRHYNYYITKPLSITNDEVKIHESADHDNASKTLRKYYTFNKCAEWEDKWFSRTIDLALGESSLETCYYNVNLIWQNNSGQIFQESYQLEANTAEAIMKNSEVKIVSSSDFPLACNAVLQDFALLRYWIIKIEDCRKDSIFSTSESWIDREIIRLIKGIIWRIRHYGKEWTMEEFEINVFISSVRDIASRIPIIPSLMDNLKFE